MIDEPVSTQQAFLQLALDSCPDLVFVKSEDLRITYANRSMLELFDPSIRDLVVGTTTAESFSEDEAAVFFAADKEAFSFGKSERLEKIVDYSGTTRHFSTIKTRFIGANGHPRILGVSTDVSNLVNTETRLREMNQSLQIYTSQVAHDFASPLATVTMIAEVIKLDKELSNSTRLRLEEAISIVTGLISRVKAVLTMCKAEAGGNLYREDILLSELISRARNSLRSSLDATHARIEVKRDVTLRCQPNLIEVVLQNLIENSLKYRSENPPLVSVTGGEMGDFTFVGISDNGVGITNAAKSTIFERGAQLDPGSSGIGLGLDMCKRVVLMHGGVIWADAKEHGGTRVCFTLSRADD